MANKTGALSDKHERFAREYLTDLNAGAAYKRCGYEVTDASAASAGSRLLKNAKILARVGELKAERAKRCEVSADNVLREVARVAFANMRDFAKWDDGRVTLSDSVALPEDLAAAVAEVAQTKDGVRIKLHGKMDALKTLGEHLGMWEGKGADAGKTKLRRVRFVVERPPEKTDAA
jgi:phage terminase small subunit